MPGAPPSIRVMLLRLHGFCWVRPYTYRYDMANGVDVTAFGDLWHVGPRVWWREASRRRQSREAWAAE